MGDPAGIGPELCLRLLHEIEESDCLDQIPLIYGDSSGLVYQLGLVWSQPSHD